VRAGEIQLHENGGKEHVMPCHHTLAEAPRAYIDAVGIAEDRNGWLFRASPRHNATPGSPPIWRSNREGVQSGHLRLLHCLLEGLDRESHADLLGNRKRPCSGTLEGIAGGPCHHLW
jgi:hypothetical protein